MSEYQLRARPIDIKYKNVYIPIHTSKMPDDVFECVYCGGYTYNDDRGNCAACGAPRGEQSFNGEWIK